MARPNVVARPNDQLPSPTNWRQVDLEGAAGAANVGEYSVEDDVVEVVESGKEKKGLARLACEISFYDLRSGRDKR